jgi:hypothetical protein
MGIREYLERKRAEQAERRQERDVERKRISHIKFKAFEKEKEKNLVAKAEKEGREMANRPSTEERLQKVGERLGKVIVSSSRTAYKGVGRRGRSGRFRRSRATPRGQTQAPRATEASYSPFAGGDVNGLAFGGASWGPERKKKKGGGGMGMFGGNI